MLSEWSSRWPSAAVEDSAEVAQPPQKQPLPTMDERVEYRPAAAAAPPSRGLAHSRPQSANAASVTVSREFKARPMSATTRPSEQQRQQHPRQPGTTKHERAQSAGARVGPATGPARGNPYASPASLHLLLLPKGVQQQQHAQQQQQQRPSSAKTDVAAHPAHVVKGRRPRSAKPERPEWNARVPHWERTIPEYDAWRDPSCLRFFEGNAASRKAHQKLRMRGSQELSSSALRE
eukprot:7391161-Prymnesium_polylepis.1